MIHRCKQCSTIFYPLLKQQVYCKKCKRKGIRYYKLNEVKQRACVMCDKEFATNRVERVYCSPQCRNEGDKRKKKPHSKTCPNCGIAFLHSKRKYCTNYCYLENKNKRRKDGLPRPIKE